MNMTSLKEKLELIDEFFILREKLSPPEYAKLREALGLNNNL